MESTKRVQNSQGENSSLSRTRPGNDKQRSIHRSDHGLLLSDTERPADGLRKQMKEKFERNHGDTKLTWQPLTNRSRFFLTKGRCTCITTGWLIYWHLSCSQ